MNWKFVLIVAAVAVICLGGGAYAGFKYYPMKNPAKTAECSNTEVVSDSSASTEETATEETSDETVQACLKAKWGEEKYQALTTNPNLATVDDKFAALPCYK